MLLTHDKDLTTSKYHVSTVHSQSVYGCHLVSHHHIHPPETSVEYESNTGKYSGSNTRNTMNLILQNMCASEANTGKYHANPTLKNDH